MLPLEVLETKKDLYKNIRYNHNMASVKVAAISGTKLRFCLFNEMVSFVVYDGEVQTFNIKHNMAADTCCVCKSLFEDVKFISWRFVNSFKELEEVKCILSFYIELNEVLDSLIDELNLSGKLKLLCEERINKYKKK